MIRSPTMVDDVKSSGEASSRGLLQKASCERYQAHFSWGFAFIGRAAGHGSWETDKQCGRVRWPHDWLGGEVLHPDVMRHEIYQWELSFRSVQWGVCHNIIGGCCSTFLTVHLRSMPRGRLRLYHLVHTTHSLSSRGGLYSCPRHYLQAAHQIGIRHIVVYGDSKLVINQVPPDVVALHCSSLQMPSS